MPNLKEKLHNLPVCPGVYIMKNADGDIIYVGKSKLLKNRVSQYFQNSRSHTPKTRSMVAHIADFDYIITDTEVEALVLECNLIKKHRPKYNILLKDDKQYPYIRVTNEEYPRIFMTRKIVKDGSKYFGPYMSAFMVKETLETLRKVFQVRSCSKILPRDIGKGRPCLYYHINQCSAPCAGNISKEEYQEIFRHISEVLEGDYNNIIRDLEQKMQEASEELAFERAARYRDKIESIKILGEKQKITSTEENNRDIIGCFQEESDICVQLFFMRGGKVVGSEHHVFERSENTPAEVMEEFVKQYYFTATNVPKEILLSEHIEDLENVEQWLTQKAKTRIHLLIPQRGEKAKITKMVIKNAEESLRQYKFKRDKENTEHNEILSALQKTLMLNKPPFRIESYDISNISGAQSVGACVVYKNAKPYKSAYRRFTIKTVEGANDYESMREIIFRRINRAYQEEDEIAKGKLTEDKAKFLPLPDLILLDGGRGHVAAIRTLFDTMGEEIPVFGMVKDDNHRTRGLTDTDSEFAVDPDSQLFRFLTRLQDEVHRFAITAYRKKHEDANVHSELENIKGIGASKRNKLLTHFINMKRIREATVEELSQVIGNAAAINVYRYFHKEGDRV